MKSKPELWKGADRIQWGCVLMGLLGETSLQTIPLVLSGLHSVEESRQVAPFQTAVRTARVLLGEALTTRAVQASVFDFLSGNHDSRSYDIDGDSLEFRARSMYDADISRAEEVLLKGLPLRPRSLEPADTSRDLVAQLSRDRRIRFRLNGLNFPSPEMHALERQQSGSTKVCWSDLELLAVKMDSMDVEARRTSQNWQGRLAEIKVRTATDTGFQHTRILTLSGLQHLVGLPGSGKTTLIVLLCVLLSRRGLRVAVFFTAIQIAREYLETLRRYDVETALLVGRSFEAHLRHAAHFAELVATEGNSGFAYTREGAELLAHSCPLPAFAESWPDESEWRFGEAPCEKIFRRWLNSAKALSGVEPLWKGKEPKGIGQCFGVAWAFPEL